MGNPSWDAEWTVNPDGTIETFNMVGDGPQIAGFWHNDAITWTNNGDGTFTAVG